MKGNQSIIQQCLGKNWERLPEVLQKHHDVFSRVEEGKLSIRFPSMMKIPLFFLSLFGVLIGKKQENALTKVKITTVKNKQIWERKISLRHSKTVGFNSTWEYSGDNRFVEYVTPFLGLEMAVKLDDETLVMEGLHYIVKLKLIKLKLPEWLLLGHTVIEEKVVDDSSYEMDFRLLYPWLGKIYQYTGVFKTYLKEE